MWLRIWLSVVLLAGVASAAMAAPTKIGPEIVVDTENDYDYRPRVAADPAGNFVVTWGGTDPDYSSRLRAFWSTGTPRTAPLDLNPPGFQTESYGFDVDAHTAVAADAAGNFVVAYFARDYVYETVPACFEFGGCILTKRLEADGDLSPATFIVADPRLFGYSMGYNQTVNPEITATGTGEFVVSWEGYDGEDGTEAVFARKLVSSGQVNGGQFRVNEHVLENQGDRGQHDVAADALGNFVVAWLDENQIAPPYGGIVFRRFDSSKNPLGAQTQVSPLTEPDFDEGYPSVARAPTGEFMVAWIDRTEEEVRARVYDSSGIAITSAFAVAPASMFRDVDVDVTASESGFIVAYTNDSHEAAGRTFDLSGASTSSEFTMDSGYAPSVAADAHGNFVMISIDEPNIYAQRFQVAAPTPKEIPLLGKVAVLTNKDPDDFEKSAGKWKASGAEIEVPLRGSASDPRCLGEPAGTVKASVRFRSAISGQDVTVDLPCEGWSATGGDKVTSVAKRGFKYSDGKRDLGPCTSVKIKGTKSLSVTCKGKPGAAAFDYDLISGVSQGALSTVLQLGTFSYCAEFQPFFNGNDGKKYKGKALAPPASCP